jgi:hypothetical protein
MLSTLPWTSQFKDDRFVPFSAVVSELCFNLASFFFLPDFFGKGKRQIPLIRLSAVMRVVWQSSTPLRLILRVGR